MTPEDVKYIRAYHFINEKYGLEALSNKRLKIARINDLNDPFEWLSPRLSDKDYRGRFSKLRMHDNATKGILCFSKKWNDPVQWSHYGDKHKGICLGFDIPIEFAADIEYVHDRLHWERDATGRMPSETISKLFVTKFKHWEYEQEVRMFLSLDEGTAENGLYFYSFGKNLVLREIIAGPMSELSLETIREAAGSNHGNVQTSKARLAFTSFSVVRDKRCKVTMI